MAHNYYLALAEAEAEIADLLAERERIDAKINLLKRLSTDYRLLLGTSAPVATPVVDLMTELKKTFARDAGISDAIRKVLSASKIPLSVPEIRSALENYGFDFSSYANAGAVIHNTLARLVKQGELTVVQNPAGQTVAYAMRSSNAARDRLLRAGNQITETKEP
jgi:hypothetical protein